MRPHLPGLSLLGVLVAVSSACTPRHEAAPVDGFVPRFADPLYYSAIGEGEPILVIHGGPGMDQSYLRPQLDRLARGHRVIYFDQRACGRSGAGEAASMRMDTLVEDVEAVRRAVAGGPVHLLAHSWGGLLAIHYTIRHPEQVRSLIMMSALGGSSTANDSANAVTAARSTAADAAARRAILTSDAWKNGDTIAFNAIMRLGFKRTLWDTVLVDELELHMPTTFLSNSRLLGGLFPDVSKYELNDALAVYHGPSLLIYGDHDPLSGRPAALLHAHLAGSRLVILKDCGHFPYIERPEECFEEIGRFLGRSAPR